MTLCQADEVDAAGLAFLAGQNPRGELAQPQLHRLRALAAASRAWVALVDDPVKVPRAARRPVALLDRGNRTSMLHPASARMAAAKQHHGAPAICAACAVPGRGPSTPNTQTARAAAHAHLLSWAAIVAVSSRPWSPKWSSSDCANFSVSIFAPRLPLATVRYELDREEAFFALGSRNSDQNGIRPELEVINQHLEIKPNTLALLWRRW